MRINEEILKKLEEADLSTTIYRTAIRIINLVDDDGRATISKEEAMEVCGTSKMGTVRRHLGTLANCEILHYSTNENIYIQIHDASVVENFASVVEQDAYRRENFASVVERDASVVENFASVVEQVHADVERLISYVDKIASVVENFASVVERVHTDAKISRLNEKNDDYATTVVSSYNSSINSSKELTTTTTTTAVDLLTDPDVNLNKTAANRYRDMDPQIVVRHIFAWFHDMESGKVNHAGALINRLKNDWRAPELTDADKQSAYYERHFGRYSFANDYLAHPAIRGGSNGNGVSLDADVDFFAAPKPDPKAEPAEPEDPIWTSIMGELELATNPYAFAMLIEGARMVRKNGVAQIWVSNQEKAEYWRSHLVVLARRKLRTHGVNDEIVILTDDEIFS